MNGSTCATCSSGSYVSGNSCVAVSGGYTGTSSNCTSTLGGTYTNGKCFKNYSTSYSAVNCQNTSSREYSAYCSGSTYTSTDYWAGAKKKCASVNMTLPADTTLQLYCNQYSTSTASSKAYTPNIGISSGNFWSSTVDSTNLAYFVTFSNCGIYGTNRGNDLNVLCVK